MRYRTRPALPARRDVPLPEPSALTMTRRGARLGFRLVRNKKTYRWVRTFESAEEATRVRGCIERVLIAAGYDDRDGEELKLPPTDPLQAWKDACIGDYDARLVYGDMLAEHGDPRAELIAAQARAESEPAAAAESARLTARYSAEILGGLDPALGYAHVEWRRGFIDAVVLARGSAPPRVDYGYGYYERDWYYDQRPPFELTTALVRLLTEASADLLRSLTLRWEGELPAGRGTAELVALLAALLPRGLEHLVLERMQTEEVIGGLSSWGDVTELFAVVPRLSRVSIHDREELVVRPFHAPSLRDLALDLPVPMAAARALASSTCPLLERLAIRPDSTSAASVDVLRGAFGERVSDTAATFD